MRQSKEFLKLQDKWYKKLEKSGFEDAEKKGYLKWSFSQNMTRTSERDKVSVHENKEEYYRLAGHFLYDYKFENKKHEHIWQFHSEGKTLEEIQILLKKYRIKLAITQIKNAIHKMRDEMFEFYKVIYGKE